MSRVWIGLGGNEEGSLEALAQARQALGKLLAPLDSSSLYRTQPLIDIDQPPFWNAVVTGLWSGSAWSLLERLQILELQAGRRRKAQRPKGPRILDLDLLSMDLVTIQSNRLTLPHPAIEQRQFVLIPRLELLDRLSFIPEFQSCRAQLAKLEPQGVEFDRQRW